MLAITLLIWKSCMPLEHLYLSINKYIIIVASYTHTHLWLALFPGPSLFFNVTHWTGSLGMRLHTHHNSYILVMFTCWPSSKLKNTRSLIYYSYDNKTGPFRVTAIVLTVTIIISNLSLYSLCNWLWNAYAAIFNNHDGVHWSNFNAGKGRALMIQKLLILLKSDMYYQEWESRMSKF